MNRIGARRPVARGLCAVVATLIATACVGAESESGGATLPRTLDVATGYQSVTNGYGDWRRFSLRAVLPVGLFDVWSLEALAQEAFEDRGVGGVIGNTHVWSDRWFSQVSAGGGTGDFVLPRFRGDASLSRKWLASRSLVTSLGGTYVRSADEHHDQALVGSVIVYPADRLVAEVGGRINWSYPGSIRSQRGFAAVTAGEQGKRYVALRVTGGTEGYQQTGPSSSLTEFASQEASLSWRQWLGSRWGGTVMLEGYHNPFYTRTGVTVGVFYEW